MSMNKLLEDALSEEYRRELDALPSSEELKEMILVSSEFHRKMEKLIKQHKRKLWLLNIGKNVAVFLALVASSFLLLFALNGEIRATCLQWVRTMTDNGMTNYKTVSSDKENKATAGFSLEYIPEGYVLKNADMREQTGHVLYYKGEKELEFYYMPSQRNNTYIDNENYTFSHIELEDGTVCDFYKDQSDKHDDTLIWQKNGYNCILNVSEIEENELIRIANEVKIVNS